MIHMVLASASPRRRELLTRMGLEIEVCPSAVDESQIGADHPRTFAIRAAFAKAQDIAATRPDGEWVLGADTVVTREMILYGKPRNKADARRILRKLSGHPHDVLTGLALVRAGTSASFLHAERTRVFFRELTDLDIDAYIASGEPMDKAGAYGIQGLGAELIDHIEGDYFNVVGLPCNALATVLEEAGIEFPIRPPKAPERWAQ